MGNITYKKGQQIVLYNDSTEEHRAVKIIQYDTRQGWLAESADGERHWYHMDNEYWPNVQHWKYVKKAGD